ncbi:MULTISPECIES: cyclase family protein [Streptomyces]|uniref:Cyclase n=1 Tax=Streptomyces noursei TaxID=1971 RepID=A0A059W379_STRNR|nr:cyclase family protein [Streptomyces noursei]AKA04465.1 cyclase [Streptomyces noursei ZPM]AIA04240.1 cyclase [Streptomyces noursei]EOT00927.1 cyclase [Streptomyces noursei CCRC 11814]EXU88217.1 cyclase [Streptomyces noursei PD-1]MCE4945256.1 cyclase family protein [Streptomyces noursei]
MPLPQEFHDLARRVNNWGRWGPDDELGTLNLITPDVVRAAAATVRSGRRVPLALPLQQDGVQNGMILGRVNPLHTMVAINHELFGPDTVAVSDDTVTMGLQAATHWDALTHVSHSGRFYNGRPAGIVTPHRGATALGIEKAAPVVSRGVLLDVARARGTERLPGGHAITPEDLDAAEEWAGTTVRAGDVVLVRTGQLQHYLAGDRDAYAMPSPGLSLRTPEWFHARDVAAVANDTLVFETFPPEIEGLWLPVHALHLVEMGMLQGQNWNLEELSTACAEEGRYAFLLTAMAEPFVGGTGSPVAPVAVL